MVAADALGHRSGEDGGAPSPPSQAVCYEKTASRAAAEAAERGGNVLQPGLRAWVGAAAPSTAAGGGTLGSSRFTMKPGATAQGMVVVISSFAGGGRPVCNDVGRRGYR
jgi:hypothetical protein